MSHYLTVLLSHCPTVTLSCYLMVSLSHYLTVPQSHYLTVQDHPHQSLMDWRALACPPGIIWPHLWAFILIMDILFNMPEASWGETTRIFSSIWMSNSSGYLSGSQFFKNISFMSEEKVTNNPNLNGRTTSSQTSISWCQSEHLGRDSITNHHF